MAILVALSCAFVLGPIQSAGAATQTVTATGNSGPGSLRDAVGSLNGSPGTDEIVFAPGLAGQTITLATPLAITKATGSLTINPAAGAVAGIKVSGGGTSALLNLTGPAPVTINQLELREGVGPPGADGVADRELALVAGRRWRRDPDRPRDQAHVPEQHVVRTSGGAGGAGGNSAAAFSVAAAVEVAVARSSTAGR